MSSDCNRKGSPTPSGLSFGENGFGFLRCHQSLAHDVLHAPEGTIGVVTHVRRFCDAYGAVVTDRTSTENFVVLCCFS